MKYFLRMMLILFLILCFGFSKTIVAEEDLVSRAESSELKEKVAALDQMGELEDPDDEVIEVLLASLEEKDNYVQKAAVRSLVALDFSVAEYLPELQEKLDSLEGDLFWELAPVFVRGAAEEKEVKDLLLEMAVKEEKELKLLGVRSLGALGTEAEDTALELLEVYESEEDRDLQLALVRSFREIAPQKTEVLLLFSELLDSEDRNLRYMAAEGLKDADDSGVLDKLEAEDDSLELDELRNRMEEIQSELPDSSGVLAFPEAEGFGAETAGGRKGEVYRVTNLEDNGPGSLREAVEAEGPRIVVFDVAGTIFLDSPLTIKNPHITIAGNTAPGQGITVANYGFTVNTNDVIVRSLRSRLGEEEGWEGDSFEVSGGENVVVDRVSASWSTDETLSVVNSDRVTVQRSIISESLDDSIHEKGPHGYGTLIRGSHGARLSFHSNLWAHHRGRSPRPGNYESREDDPEGLLVDFRNNVFYNWEGSYAGYNHDDDSITKYNFVNNYYQMGPSSGGPTAFQEGCPHAQAYFAGNKMIFRDGSDLTPDDPWRLVDGETGGDYKQEEPFASAEATTRSGEEAYDYVLAGAGAVSRDEVDERIISDVKEFTGGIIDSQEDVGGWPELISFSAAQDSSGNGIPDWWQIKYGFSPQQELDPAGDLNQDGYTNIEDYINGTSPEKLEMEDK
ncbi:MAG: hypothetical protein ACOC2G_02585 [Bacillota bacterium]